MGGLFAHEVVGDVEGLQQGAVLVELVEDGLCCVLVHAVLETVEGLEIGEVLECLGQDQPTISLQPILPKRQHLNRLTVPDLIHILFNPQCPQPTVRRIEILQFGRLLQNPRKCLGPVHSNSIIAHIDKHQIPSNDWLANISKAFRNLLPKPLNKAITDLHFLI